jgi:hypothetical protein
LIADRRTDDESVRGNPPNELHRHVFRTQVSPRRSCCNGNVWSIVHQHGHRQGRHELPDHSRQFSRIRLLQAELHRRNTASLGCARERHQIATLGQTIVGDQHQPHECRYII